MRSVIETLDGADEHPERTARAGELLLPAAPESCYPPDGVALPFEPAEVDA